MKKHFNLFALCMCLALLANPVSAKASEKVQESAEAKSFSELIEEKPIYALVYNTYEYQVKESPGSLESVVTVSSGQQVILQDCTLVGSDLWFLCDIVKDGIPYQGFIEQKYIISGDRQYNQWLEEIDAGGSDAIVYADAAGGSSVRSSDFANYVNQYFPYEYRQALIELHQKHPQWSFVPFYTGLDWNTVIRNEMVPTRNLIYKTAKDEWKSKAEGDYDPSTGTYIGKSGPNWVQASQEAVEYFMNPMNFLDEKSVFMFEQLTYDAGAHVHSGVEAVLRGTWMSNKALEDGSWPSYAAAFMEIASRTGVSPYHLASRIRQEQGTAGDSSLISGTVEGYEGYYNYFNISASGSTNSEIIANGLTYARKRGWNSRFASLLGGAQIISSSYISKGQDTLYLQKFDVDGSYDGLYSHQYMQNVQAPYTEGQKVFDAYNAIASIGNSFVFKIPVYNNLGVYEGNINSELKSFALNKNAEGRYYLQGEIVVVEWVNGVSTVPPEKPVMYFESTDGEEKIDVYVTPTGTNTYYFDRFIEGLTVGREYVFRVESGSEKNISAAKSMTLLLGNSSLAGSADLGKLGSQMLRYYTNSRGELVICAEEYHYVGNINSELKGLTLNTNEQGATYLAGEIVVVEWVDGVSTVPSEPPVMAFKSSSGEEITVFVTPTGTNTYYFDRFIEGLKVGEEYYFEISSGSSYNISDYKTMRVNLDTSPQMEPEADLGETGGSTLAYKRNGAGELTIFCKTREYRGDVNSQLERIEGRNVDGIDYISGEIIIVEWVDGKSTVPSALPKMWLESEDGLESMEVFVTPTGTNTYYFDRGFGYLRPEVGYTLRVESGSLWNQSEHRSMIVTVDGLPQQEGLLCQTEAQDIGYRMDRERRWFVICAENR